MDDSPVLIRREGAITRITLNRPRVINALSREMIALTMPAIARAAEDGSTAILLDGAGERGFCGGGDVKELAGLSVEEGIEYFRSEYRFDHALHASAAPVVGVMRGISMGGGIGMAGHAAVRVVTETSRLAMPETRIGIAPDVGGHHLLAAAPGRLGEFLAASSGGMDAGDAIALGFADRFVPEARLGELAELLIVGIPPREAVDRVAGEAPVSWLPAAREWFDPIADRALGTSADTLADPASAAARLVQGLEASEREEATELATEIRQRCPMSVAVTLAQIARTRQEGLSLAEVLADDLRVLGRLLRRADFAEGVRAQLIDKDGDPRWSPARIEEIDPAELAAILDPVVAAGESALAIP